jgi:hypothetical protein
MDPDPTLVLGWLLAGNKVDAEALAWLKSITVAS